jgi:hypothetical protein
LKLKIAVAGGGVMCALLLAQTLARASRPEGIDLTSYLLSARAVMHGDSPYALDTPFPYLYPATLAFLLIPLALVTRTVGVVVWFAGSVAAVAWAIRKVLLMSRRDRFAAVGSNLQPRRGDVAVLLAVFFTFFFTIAQSNLRNGQVNFIVLALCVAAAARDQRPATTAPSCLPALLWSLAIAIKIVPVALMPYFALRRRWTWIVASLLLAAAWSLLPAATLGNRIINIYQQYWHAFLASSFAPRPHPLDFSLAGTIAALAGAGTPSSLRIGAAILVVGAVTFTDVQRFRRDDARPLALYLLAIPLVSPQSEVHHLAFALPAAVVVAGELWAAPRQAPRSLRFSVAIAAILYLAATAAPRASGPLFCAAMIVVAVAVVKPPPMVRPKPDATDAPSWTKGSGRDACKSRDQRRCR